MKNRLTIYSLLFLAVVLPATFTSAATIAPPRKPHAKSHHVTESAAAQKKMARMKHSSRTTASVNRSSHVVVATSARKGKKATYYERFHASSFADDQVDGDIVDGEDPIVRAAAIEALGNMNGTVVSIDPTSGRILAMVNQKLALSARGQPSSTIKVAVALAALSENVITKDTEIPLGKYYRMDLTTALAHRSEERRVGK